MIGNISKTRGVLGSTGPRGPQGIQGEKGDTPSITFRYEIETGNLYYDSDGLLIDKEYADSKNYVLKSEVEPLLLELLKKVTQSRASITLYVSEWKDCPTENMYYQVVKVENAKITEYSKIDLQPSPEQLNIFHEKDIAFVAENRNKTVTVYCIGQKPSMDYTIQATVTEVTING